MTKLYPFDTPIKPVTPAKEFHQTRYSVEMDVGGRHLRFANYHCSTLEEAEQEIAEAFRIAREIRDEAPIEPVPDDQAGVSA